MKKILCLLLASTLSVSAVDLLLIWDKNPDDQQVTGYNVYEFVSPNWVMIGGAVTNGFSVVNASPGKHTYAVTATNLWGESLRSDSVSTPASPGKPTNLRVEKK